MSDLLTESVTPDYEAFLGCIMRQGAPKRVHNIELFLDGEVKDALCARFGIDHAIDRSRPYAELEREITIQRFLGYDYVRCGLEGQDWPFNRSVTQDTAVIQRQGGRGYIDEHVGPVTNWEEFERYPWPDPVKAASNALEWYERNLPDDMCVIGGGGFGHFAEHLTWLMGYETLCYALFDQRDLVQAICDKMIEIFTGVLDRILEFNRVKIVWGSDDMGYRGGTLISPEDTRKYMLPGHKLMASMAHKAGKPYLLHSCGNLFSIMNDLIDDVRIDGKHSFEDTIESVIEDKRLFGDRLTLLGGIDVDFLCNAKEDAIRKRVRDTLDVCMEGGGYCLGTGNSVTNYIPVDSYLVMLDEGRMWRG